jgi:hypothetical protein
MWTVCGSGRQRGARDPQLARGRRALAPARGQTLTYEPIWKWWITGMAVSRFQPIS